MGEQDLELEKMRLISLALEFGFDEESAKQCLDSLVLLYGDDGQDFITVEHCGDDFLASLAECMQYSEDWDDVQAMESEACGALTEILDKDLLQVDNAMIEEGTQIHVIEDSTETYNHRTIMQLDSSSDSEEVDISIPSKKRVKPSISIDDSGCDPYPSLNEPSSCSLDYRSHFTQSPVSSVSNDLRHFNSFKNTNGTLAFKKLQQLDDFELANVVVFGNSTFRPLQHQTCKAFLAQRDCFVLMPTGGGKSLCYQLSAILQPGVMIVISPLLSLIQDQIVTLNLKFGIPATFLNSQQSPSQAAAILLELRKDKPSCKLLYMTPERVAGNVTFQEILHSLHRKGPISWIRC